MPPFLILRQKLPQMKIENTNLRLVDGLLRPVGKPVLHSGLAGSTPLGYLDGQILAFQDNKLYLGSKSEKAELDAAIRCAVIQGSSKALVMTAKGPVEVRASEGTLSVKSRTELPAVHLTAAEGTPVSVDVEKRTLSAAISERRFKDSDAKAIKDDFCDAYCRLCATAAGSGEAIQPALARYRLIDREGNVAFTSPTVFLSLASGPQCAGYKALYRLEGNTLRGYSLEARTWQLEIGIPAANRDDISRLDVYVSPLFHPYDRKSEASIIMTDSGSAAEPVARIALPGNSRATSHTFGESIVRGIFARMDSVEKRVASVHNPFSGTARTILIAPSSCTDPMSDTTAIDKALARAVEPADRIMTMLTAPHRFSAAMVADSGGALMWSGVRALRCAAPSPEFFAAEGDEDEGWTASVGVRFKGSKGVTGVYSGSAGAFTTLGPILSYPSADAEEMYISVSKDGKYYTGTFPLCPDASGRTAFYMAPQLGRIELVEDKGPIIMSFGDASVELPGTVVFSRGTAANEVLAYSRISDECTALLGRRPLNHAWDFGRKRFIAATAKAIYSVALSAAGAVSVNKIADGGAERSDALSPGPQGRPCYVDSTSGNIYSLNDSGRPELLARGEDYVALAWNEGWQELWALRSSGACTIFGPEGAFMRDDCSFTSFAARMGLCEAGIAELGNESGGECAIRYTHTLDGGKAVRLLMRGGEVDGYVTLFRTTIDGEREFMLRKVYITGSCHDRLHIPLPKLRHRLLRLELAATVSADFTLKPL